MLHNEDTKKWKATIVVAALNSIFVIVPSWEFGLVFFILHLVYPQEQHMKSRCFYRTRSSLFWFLTAQLLFCLGKIVPTVPFQAAYEIHWQMFSGMQKHIIRIVTNTVSTNKRQNKLICKRLFSSFVTVEKCGLKSLQHVIGECTASILYQDSVS